jgi:hypothetical protein
VKSSLKWVDFDFEEGTLLITQGTVQGRLRGDLDEKLGAQKAI